MNVIKIFACFIAVCGMTSAFEDKTIFQWLQDNHRYTTLISYLRQTGLDILLSSPGAHTLLAPTDTAFQNLRTTLPTDVTELQKILQHHVLSEYILIPIISGYKEIIALDGTSMTLHESHGSGFVDNGTHIVQPLDVVCNNGVVQTVDDVLFPPPASAATHLNIAQLLIRSEATYRDFALYMMLTGFMTILEGGEYTVFAANNAAFAPIAQQLVSPRPGSPVITQDMYRQIAKYYIAPGARTLATLHRTPLLYTLEGYPLNITTSSTGDTYINGYSKIIQSDIIATNGVLHIIDNLISPKDINDMILAQVLGTTTTTPSPLG